MVEHAISDVGERDWAQPIVANIEANGTREPHFMALSIKDPETERLVRNLAQLTGETITTAIKRALEERLRRVGGPSRKATLLHDLAEIRGRWSAMPVLDHRTPEQILDYDEHGLPH